MPCISHDGAARHAMSTLQAVSDDEMKKLHINKFTNNKCCHLCVVSLCLAAIAALCAAAETRIDRRHPYSLSTLLV
jgi:hypothetical protein